VSLQPELIPSKFFIVFVSMHACRKRIAARFFFSTAENNWRDDAVLAATLPKVEMSTILTKSCSLNHSPNEEIAKVTLYDCFG
jgi:hypothetical protein